MSIPGDDPQSHAINVQINNLWFISLVLSVATASIGILIKEWLREYKTVDSRFSQTRMRLRIRQFRYPGLTAWKVFEIAAFLPLLIQASLGLFFTGLCISTWSVDPVIGKSVTSLVVVWFAFFVGAAFAPALSSACPYKIPPLLPLLKLVRRLIVRFGILQWLYVGSIVRTRNGEVETKPMMGYWPRLRSHIKRLALRMSIQVC